MITRLNELCPTCGKPARTKSIDTFNEEVFTWLECGHLIVSLKIKETDYSSLRSRDNKAPYKFQTEGMAFLEQALAYQKGGCIFDPMGIGKTVQALGFIAFHEVYSPTLYVVKSGLKYQWMKEIMRWCGDMYLPQVITSSKDYIIPNLKSYIISFDTLARFDLDKLSFVKLIVIDECQHIKNPDAARTIALRKLAGSSESIKVIGLSGTPWKNRGSEFFTILNLVDPRRFYSYNSFIRNWVDTYDTGTSIKEAGIKNPARFKEYISNIAIRREIEDVLPDMPSVVRNIHFCELDKHSKNLYDDEVSEFVDWFRENEEDINSTSLIGRLQKMRHITGLSKIPVTTEMAQEFIESTEDKLTIFVHHKDVGEILYSNLSSALSVPVFKLSADMDDIARQKLCDNFNNTKSCVLIASTLASGEGLNLQTCSNAYLHERQWNPQNEDQAAPGRFRRIGSTAEHINITFITAEGTIDDFMAALVEEKRVMFEAAMTGKTYEQDTLIKDLAHKIVSDFLLRQSLGDKSVKPKITSRSLAEIK